MVGPVRGSGVGAEVIAYEEILHVVHREGGVAAAVIGPPAVVLRFAASFERSKGPVDVAGLAVAGSELGFRLELHLVVLVGMYRYVGPIQETFHHRGSVLDAESSLYIRFAGEDGEPYGPHKPLAEFSLTDPDGLAAVGVLGNLITGIEGG